MTTICNVFCDDTGIVYYGMLPSVKTALISVNATSSRTTTRNNRYSNNRVNRNDVNSSTVLVFSYRYEHAEDRIPVCRGVCRGVGK
jgi:hypothetical protein